MAKKDFKERIAKRNLDVTDPAKELFSQQTTGEHKDGYKDVVIRLRITAEEKDRWQQKAKEQYNKSLSSFIRENVNYNIEHGVTAGDLLKK